MAKLARAAICSFFSLSLVVTTGLIIDAFYLDKLVTEKSEFVQYNITGILFI